MNAHDTQTRVELIDLLAGWWWKESRHPCGPSNPELAKRVQDALLQNRQEREEHSRGGELRHKDSNSMLLALLNETRGVSLKTNKPPSPPVMDEPLSENELAILRALREAAPKRLRLIDLEADADLNQKTIGKTLPRLVELGLVDYVASARKGAALTPAGREFVDSLQSTP